MAIIALVKRGAFQKRLPAARHASKRRKYRLVKSHAINTKDSLVNFLRGSCSRSTSLVQSELPVPIIGTAT